MPPCSVHDSTLANFDKVTSHDRKKVMTLALAVNVIKSFDEIYTFEK
jgi:hypothetical protein